MHNVHTVVTPYTASCLVCANSVLDMVIVTAPRKSARLTPRMQCDTSGALLYNLHKLSPVLCSSLALLDYISYQTCLKSFTAEMKSPYFSYINNDNYSLPSHLQICHVICIFQWQMQSGGIVPFQSHETCWNWVIMVFHPDHKSWSPPGQLNFASFSQILSCHQ